MSATALTPFRAFVDQNLITSASSFFDNSNQSILRELLQNSRRSGATRADLHLEGHRWRYSDNGPGCVPLDLLGLGSSNWNSGVASRESPAGCGFFSLARRNPAVTCPRQGWRVVLTEDHFNGSAVIEPEPYTAAPEDEEIGMTISFDCGESSSLYGIEDLARFMPIEFFINGKKMKCHEDFMATPVGSIAHRVVEINEFVTARVDLVNGHAESWTACYQGFVVSMCDRDYTAFGVATDGGRVGIRVAVMVSRERAMPLELPQRSRMVKSDFTAALVTQCRNVGLELAAHHLQDSSLASPEMWLNARSSGYTGPVLYPKIVGRLVTRREGNDMELYSLSVGDDHKMHERGRYITFKEFEAGDYRFSPDGDMLSFIAQTVIPSHEIPSGHGSVYDLDLDEYFAPGLRLVRLLKSLGGFRRKEGQEGYEFSQYLDSLVQQRGNWHDHAEIVAEGTDEDGKPIQRTKIFGSYRSLSDDVLYDKLTMRFVDANDAEEAHPIELPVVALFHMPGDKDDIDVEFIATKQWFQEMPSGFATEVAAAAYNFRNCSECDSEEDVTIDRMIDNLNCAFAVFTGLDDFYKEKFITAAEEAVETGLYHLKEKPGRVIIDLKVHGNVVLRAGRSTCTFEPPFSASHTFEGSHGKVSCDATGKRDHYEEPEPGETERPYPEFHSFDVETMLQLGFGPGHHDILNACGWHDSTKKIYLLPELEHLLWSLGYIPEPKVEQDDRARVLYPALTKLIADGKVSDTLFSAIWAENAILARSCAPESMKEAPPQKLWVL